MDAARIVILLVGVGASLGQENGEHGYLTQLTLSLREEKIPSIVNYLLNNSLEAHAITTQDIVSLSKLDKFNQDEVASTLQFFNISEVYTVDNLEIFLNALNISFGDFYEDLKTDLGLSNDQVTQVMNSLSIPADFWRDVFLHQDDALYNDLRQGIYDEEHVTKALAATGRDLTQVYSAARDVIVAKVNRKSSSEFMSILKTNGWTHRTAMTWYRALNLTTRDVYRVERFRQIFTNITDELNQNLTLGVFTDVDRLALHRLAYDNLQKLVDGVNVKVEGRDSEVILKKTRSLGENIVEVASDVHGSDYIEITKSYNSSGTCSYVTLLDGQVTVTEVTVVDYLTVSKDSIKFVLGSPLICEGSLYGLAREEQDALVVFDGFYTEDHPPGEIETDKENGNGGLDSLPCVLIVTFNLLIVFVLL